MACAIKVLHRSSILGLVVSISACQVGVSDTGFVQPTGPGGGDDGTGTATGTGTGSTGTTGGSDGGTTDDGGTGDTGTSTTTSQTGTTGTGICGNGIEEAGEECDDGNDDDTDACLSTCEDASCGDGFLYDGVEECDDGNADDTDDCLSTCEDAGCGDGHVWDGMEECDDGNADETDDCLSTCEDASCGDGFLWDGVEECDDSNQTPWDGCSDVCALEPLVEPLYPNNGAGWNDYVKNDGASLYAATDTACAGTEAGGYDACLHGGEMRAVSVTGQVSCTGLTATETLGAFDWVCDGSTNPVRFVTRGLNASSYLSDLVDFDTGEWLANGVRIMNGATEVFRTADTVWWSNPVEINDTGGDLTVAGTIYLVSSNPSAVYDIGAERIGFVVRPGVAMQGSGTGVDVVDIGSGPRFLWLEGSFDASGDARIVDAASGLAFSVFRGFRGAGGSSDGIRLTDATNCLLRDVFIGGLGDNGLELAGTSVGNVITHASFSGCGNRGLDVSTNCSGNVIVDIVAANNGTRGISFSGTNANNVVAGATITNNGDDGIYLGSSGQANAVLGVAIVNNGGDGIQIASPTVRTTFSNVIVANNTTDGLRFYSSVSDNVVADFVAVSNGQDGVQIGASANNSYFTGVFKVGGNGVENCNVSASATNPGITDATCVGNGSSDFTLTTGASVASSHVGKVTTTDGTNQSNTNGTEPYVSITDWVDFERRARAWGLDGAAFPAADHQGQCALGTCRIWDFSLRSADTVLRAVASLPNGNATLPHDDGAVTILRNAYEIVDDDIGDDDGLCESSETCMFLPNVGGYQGHGALSAASFTDGTLTGIDLLEHASNGY